MATPVGPYTPVVKAGDFLYISGQIGIDANGNLVEGFADQAKTAIGNLLGLLGENGATAANLVKTTLFVTDMGNYAAVNDIYTSLLGEVRPARSAVAVAALPKGAEFEIEAIAYVG